MRRRLQLSRKYLGGITALLAALVTLSAIAAPTPDPYLGLPRMELSEREQELASLGRRVFLDQRFSADGKISCGSCQLPERAFTDGRAQSIGHAGQLTTRNAPSLVNVAYLRSLFWDGRAENLEAQARAPLTNPVEHALPDSHAVIRLILENHEYRTAFINILNIRPDQIAIDHVLRAIAAFERSLRAGRSPFDRYQYGGEKQALSAGSVRGLELFRGKAGCVNCHSIGEESALFTDESFHVTPVGLPRDVTQNLVALTNKVLAAKDRQAEIERLIATDKNISALGRFIVTRDPRDIGSFKTPTLRNVALTGPYMHDGSIGTLDHAVDLELYGRGKAVRYPIVLTLSEKRDLIEFLTALTSEKLSF